VTRVKLLRSAGAFRGAESLLILQVSKNAPTPRGKKLGSDRWTSVTFYDDERRSGLETHDITRGGRSARKKPTEAARRRAGTKSTRNPEILGSGQSTYSSRKGTHWFLRKRARRIPRQGNSAVYVARLKLRSRKSSGLQANNLKRWPGRISRPITGACLAKRRRRARRGSKSGGHFSDVDVR